MLSAGQLKLLMNIWPPFWGAGIQVKSITPDFKSIKTQLKLRWYNRNYVKTQYGGSLYSMTDPFYMLMLLHRLGKEYIVWDMQAEIRYIHPAASHVTASFEVSDEKLQEIKSKVSELGKYNPVFKINIIDSENRIIAEVRKTLYIKKKG